MDLPTSPKSLFLLFSVNSIFIGSLISSYISSLSLFLQPCNTICMCNEYAKPLYFLLQAKESESDPLLNVENGTGILADGVVPNAPVWKSNKDLHA